MFYKNLKHTLISFLKIWISAVGRICEDEADRPHPSAVYIPVSAALPTGQLALALDLALGLCWPRSSLITPHIQGVCRAKGTCPSVTQYLPSRPGTQEPGIFCLSLSSWNNKAWGKDVLIQAYFVSSRFTLPHLAATAFCTNWRFVSSKSISAIFPTAFAHFVSLCHILVILTIFQTFSSLLYLLWWSVFSNLWCYYWNCFGAPWTMPI